MLVHQRVQLQNKRIFAAEYHSHGILTSDLLRAAEAAATDDGDDDDNQTASYRLG